MYLITERVRVMQVTEKEISLYKDMKQISVEQKLRLVKEHIGGGWFHIILLALTSNNRFK